VRKNKAGGVLVRYLVFHLNDGLAAIVDHLEGPQLKDTQQQAQAAQGEYTGMVAPQ
jgi:hypothetical protein